MSVRIEPELRNGRFVYDVRVKAPEGRLRERANVPEEVRTRLGAKRWADARAAFLAKHGKSQETPESPTLREWSLTWMGNCRANKLKPATLDAYGTRLRLHVLPALGGVRLAAVDAGSVQKLKTAMAKLDAKTVNDALGVLSGMLTLAEERKILAHVPKMHRLKVESAGDDIRFHDFEEWERLVAGAAKAGPMVYAMMLLGGEAGLRRGEMIALEQVDVGPAEITVRWNEWKGKKGTPKGNRVRRIPMTERLRAAVAAVRHLRGKRLLWQPSGKRVKVTTLQSWLETACRRAGLPESRDLHKLRHTFCSHLAMRGATAKAIQELAGHADLSTTMRYMHLSPAHKADAIKLLEQGAAVAVRGAGGERDSK